MTVFDVIVVGAGVEGSATAYQLIKHGAKKVLLLEQVLNKLSVLSKSRTLGAGWCMVVCSPV